MKIIRNAGIAALLFLAQSNVFAQGKDCKSFRNGTFTSTDEETETVTLIERSGKTQSESTDGGKKKAIFNITWANDCTYTLRPTRQTLKQHPDWPKNTQFTVTITETGEDGYTQESSSSLNDVKVTNKIKKVK